MICIVGVFKRELEAELSSQVKKIIKKKMKTVKNKQKLQLFFQLVETNKNWIRPLFSKNFSLSSGKQFDLIS